MGEQATLDVQIEVAAGRRAPYTQLGDWVALSGVSAHAKALYWHLSMHVNIERGDFEVWPSRETLAEWCGFTKTSSVDRYVAELAAIGAVEVRVRRYANGMRTRNRYVIHQAPPAGHTGPRSLAEWYERHRGDDSRSPSQGTTARPAETRKAAGRPVVPSRGPRQSPAADSGSPPQRTGTQTKEELDEHLSLADHFRALGVDEAEEREIISWVKTTRPDVRSPRAYLRTVAANGDLPGLLAEWRQARETQTHVAVLPPWCGRCGVDTMPLPDGRRAAALNVRLRFVGDDGTPCPDCHPSARAAS